MNIIITKQISDDKFDFLLTFFQNISLKKPRTPHDQVEKKEYY